MKIIKNLTWYLVLSLIVGTSVVGAVAAQSATFTVSITWPADNHSVEVGQSIHFSAIASGGKSPVSYVWDFGDGHQAAGSTFDKSYDHAGAFIVKVTATDDDGRQETDSVHLMVGNSQPVTPLSLLINSPANNTSVLVGQSLDFAATASGGKNPFSYVWDFGNGDQVAGPTFTKLFNQVGAKTVSVTVTDDDGRQKSASVNITVVDLTPPPPQDNSPTVALTINGHRDTFSLATGTTATIAWTSTNTVACEASQAWTGAKSISGSETIGPFTSTSTQNFGITCLNAAGLRAVDTVVLTVTGSDNNGGGNNSGGGGGGGNAKPVISNIRVTDVTETSAIVRWTTDKAANSRVIYDSTSHPSIAGASFPNFGYASSSATQDDSAKVTEHAVTLTSLTVSTTYYFRVLSQ